MGAVSDLAVEAVVQRSGRHMRQRWRFVLGALLPLVVLTAACEEGAGPEGAATVPTVLAEPDGDESVAPAIPHADASVTAEMAWPDGRAVDVIDIVVPAAEDATVADVEVVRTIDFNGMTGESLTVRAVSADGAALFDAMDREAFDMEAWGLNATSPVHLWTEIGLEPVGDTTELVHGDPHRQVISGALVGDALTWHETASVDMFVSDWRMFRRNVDGGDVELLARSEQVHPAGDLPTAVGDAKLAPSGDRVGWHTTYARDDGTLRTRLVSVPTAGGELREEADLVAMPEGVADGWVVLRMIDQSVPGAEKGWEIQDPNTVAGIGLVEPGGGSRTLVELTGGADGTTESWGLAQLAAGGGEVYAWTASDGHAYAATVDGRTVTRLRQPPGMEVVPHSLAVCDELVVWSAAGPAEESPVFTYLFDPASEEIALLPSTNSLGQTTCGGSYIAWTEISPHDVDERTLTLARHRS